LRDATEWDGGHLRTLEYCGKISDVYQINRSIGQMDYTARWCDTPDVEVSSDAQALSVQAGQSSLLCTGAR